MLSQFGNEAVFDKETGLVWGRFAGDTNADGTSDANDEKSWFDGHRYCNDKRLGGRKGWRLPTIQELASLVDTSNNPALPDDHPFLGPQSSSYWSATTGADGASIAWGVGFDVAGVGTFDKGSSIFVWCVRGGQGVDPQ